MSSPLVHFQFATPDPEGAQAFLAELFDWDFRPGGGRVAATIDTKHREIVPNEIMPGGSLLRLREGSQAYTAVFVRVADLDAVLSRARALGAGVLVSRTRDANGTDVAVIATPQGLTLGLVQL
jgi:predicted enzyme related to lactoylglutathione lyase